MKAIPTMYRGVQFRSRLEARWAEFMDLIGLVWEYEPEGVQMVDGTRYLPDFWLPLVHHRGKQGAVYLEIKPTSPSEGEQHKARLLAWGSAIPVIVVETSPGPRAIECFEEHVGGMDGWHDTGLQLARCDNCGQVDIGFYASDEPACPCGKDSFNPFNSTLDHARAQFPNLARWKAAA